MQRVGASVASFARTQEANRARRRCGWSIEKAAESREGEISEETDGENRDQTKSRFSYSASKGVKPNQRNWSAIFSFEKRSILFLKKIRSKFFLIFDRKQSFEKGENLKREQKKKEDKTIGRGIGQVLRVDKLMHPSPAFRIGFL